MTGKRLACAAALTWLGLVVVAGGRVAARASRWLPAPAFALTPATASSAWMLLTFTALAVPALTARLLKPGWTIPCLLAVTGGMAALLAVTMGAGGALVWLVLLALTCYELGRASLVALQALPADRAERAALGLGLGGGLLGLWVFAIGLVGQLTRPLVLLPILASIGVAARRGRRWLTGAERLRGLPAVPAAPGWFATILLALLATSALLGYTMALAPEALSDAVRVHLPMARYFAATHAIGAVPGLPYATLPVQGQALFAAAIVLHGVALAKLLHTAAGLLAVFATGVLARRYARGATAGILAAALLGCLPVATWEFGVGYIDLFATAYAPLAALCLLALRAQPDWRRAVPLGACLGFGLAAKLTFGFTVAALALALVGAVTPWPTAGAWGRLSSGIGLGALVAAGPWLARSAWLTGSVPGMSLLAQVLERDGSTGTMPGSNLGQFGLGRGPLALVRLPLELTLHSGYFGENPNGFVGFALLGLLPLLALLPRRRDTLALVLLTTLPALGWFLTAQYIRYLLPTLALLAALLGAAFVRFAQRLRDAFGATCHAAALARLGAVLAIALAAPCYFDTIAAYPGGLPVALILHRERPEDYLGRVLRPYRATRYLDSIAPPDEPVVALPEGLPLYTHTQLIDPHQVAPELLQASSIAELLDSLAARRVRYIMVESGAIPATWAQIWIVRPEFLGRYTEALYTAEGVTLYRLRAP